MTWSKLDDHFGDHPKVEALTDAAFRTLVRTFCWANRHGTGGVVKPGCELSLTRGRRKAWTELVHAGFLEKHPEGWKVHDWEEWGNETADEAKARKAELSEKRREAGRKGASKRWQPDSKLPPEPDGNPPGKTMATGMAKECPSSSSVTLAKEDPSSQDLTGHAREPEATTPGFEGQGRKTVCPLDLEARLTELGVVRELAKAHKTTEPVIAHELHEFVGYWTIGGGIGETKDNWPKAFRQRVHTRASQNLLKAPGAVEHEANTPDELERRRQADVLTTALQGSLGPRMQELAAAGDMPRLMEEFARGQERRRQREARKDGPGPEATAASGPTLAQPARKAHAGGNR